MHVSNKAFYFICQKNQSNNLEYIASFKRLYKSLEVKIQSCLPFSPNRIAKVLTSLRTNCNKGYLDNWHY